MKVKDGILFNSWKVTNYFIIKYNRTLDKINIFFCFFFSFFFFFFIFIISLRPIKGHRCLPHSSVYSLSIFYVFTCIVFSMVCKSFNTIHLCLGLPRGIFLFNILFNTSFIYLPFAFQTCPNHCILLLFTNTTLRY